MLAGTMVDLRVVEPTDLPRIAEWLNDPAFNGEFERFDQVTLDQLGKELGGEAEGRWYVVQTKDGVPIGYANHGRVGGRLWIGYALEPAARGRGYATEAARLLVDYLFLHETVERIQAETHPDNVPSRRVLEKTGFQPEGRLRRTAFSRGAWRDSLIFSILRQEWGSPRILAIAQLATVGIVAG